MKQISTVNVAFGMASFLAVALSSSCTMKDQQAPPLTGPSQYGTGIVVAASPDAITQDGASQSLITVTAYDSNGKPLRNLSLRTEIFFGGTRVDFGSLSARNIVTGADGRATLTYTAPASPSGPTVDTRSAVQIAVTPIGTDFANEVARVTSIRLVPPGVVVPADGLQPYFAMSNSTALDHELILFDACNDPTKAACAPPNNPIVKYAWDFGDGHTATGRSATHSYDSEGTYVVVLTVTDGVARTATTSRTVKVAPSTDGTTADFTFSPDSPVGVNTEVTFDASASRTPQNSAIVRYEWSFGDGTGIFTGTSPLMRHTYVAKGTFTVTLIVYDNRGGDALGAGTTRGITVK